jgi:membrane-associated phospholipid phosphatase
MPLPASGWRPRRCHGGSVLPTADACLLLLVILCISRMNVVAHTPLDLISGAALGVSAGFAANLLIGLGAEAAPILTAGSTKV